MITSKIKFEVNPTNNKAEYISEQYCILKLKNQHLYFRQAIKELNEAKVLKQSRAIIYTYENYVSFWREGMKNTIQVIRLFREFNKEIQRIAAIPGNQMYN